MAADLTRRQLLTAAACAASGAAACRREDAVQLFAAASLEPALTEVVGDFEARSGMTVATNYAGSNTLARQIASTRAADVFFSADERWMDWLTERALIDASTRRLVLTNRLVVVARKDSSLSIENVAGLRSLEYSNLVLAETDSVPAGRYARAWLTHSALWSVVEARIVSVVDVRAVLAAVQADPRRIGITYASELVRAPGFRVLLDVPVAQHPRIGYSAALVEGGPRPREGRRLLDHLTAEALHPVYRRHGFVPLTT